MMDFFNSDENISPAAQLAIVIVVLGVIYCIGYCVIRIFI